MTTDIDIPTLAEIKSLPPTWWGIAFGGAAAGAAVFPNHRIIAAAIVAAGVLLLAHNVTKPCCSACAGDPTNGHPPIKPGPVFSDDAPLPKPTPDALFAASAVVRGGGGGCAGCS